MWARAAIVVLWVTAACYSPNPATGVPCGPGGACPAGLSCSSDNVCGGGPIDVDHDAAPPTDGEPVDAAARTRWAIVSSKGKAGTAVAITPTQAGTTMLVGIETSHTNSASSVTDNAGNVYEIITGSRALNTAGTAGVEVWMARNLEAGATTITASGVVIHAVVAWEVANLAADPVAVVDTRSDQPASTMPTGVDITTTKQGQFVLSIAIVENQLSGLVPGSAFTNDHTTFGNGWAHLTDDDAPPGTYQPQWNQAVPGTSCATSVVFDTAP